MVRKNQKRGQPLFIGPGEAGLRGSDGLAGTLRIERYAWRCRIFHLSRCAKVRAELVRGYNWDVCRAVLAVDVTTCRGYHSHKDIGAIGPTRIINSTT
jgi:hypothetical protein